MKFLKLILPIFFLFIFESCDLIETVDNPLDEPTHAVINIDNKIYVSDGYFNSRVVSYDMNGRFIDSWGSKGYSINQFHTPHSISHLSNGTLLVCDRDNSRIQLFDLSGSFVAQWHSSLIGRPWSLAVDENDYIYVVDGGDQNPREQRAGIVILDNKGNFVKRFSSFGSELGQLNWPHSIALDSDKSIFVVDLNNERIQKFERIDGDSFDYQVDTLWIINANMNITKPLGIAVFKDEVYVSQNGENLPLIVLNRYTGKRIREIGHNLFKQAHGISINNDGAILIADREANQILKMDFLGNVQLKIK